MEILKLFNNQNFYYFNLKDIQEFENLRKLLNIFNPELNLNYLKNKFNVSQNIISLKSQLTNRTGNFLETSSTILGQDLISIVRFFIRFKI